MSSSRPTTGRPARPAFGAPASRPATPPPPPAAPAVDVPVLEAGVFEQDKVQLEKNRKKTPAAQAKAEDKARAGALQAVHMAHLLAPAIAQAMSGGGHPDQQAQAFVDTMARLRDGARAWVERWSVQEEDKPWVTASLERVLAQNPALLELSDPDAFLAGVPGHLPPPPPSWLPLEVAAPLALLQALGPVCRAQARHGLGRPDPQSDLVAASRLLAEAGQDAIVELVDPGADTSLRTTVFCAVVPDAGQTLAQLWEHHGAALATQRAERNHAQQQMHERAHPHGEDLEPVFQSFREHAARLRRLARAARPRSS